MYVLAQILHDWDDERAVAILRNCRRSIAGHGRLLVLEQVLPEGDEPSYAKLLDLVMLVMLGGKERTRGEWRALLQEGGFELVDVTPGVATSSSRPYQPESAARPCAGLRARLPGSTLCTIRPETGSARCSFHTGRQ